MDDPEQILKSIPKPPRSRPRSTDRSTDRSKARAKLSKRNAKRTKPKFVRPKVDATAFARAVDELKAQGFTERRGRPRAGERALGPALADRFGLQMRQVRVLLRKRRAPFSKESVLPRSASAAAGGPPTTKETPALYAARMKLQRALGTKVELLDQSASGIVVIHWAGYTHLEELMTRLGA